MVIYFWFASKDYAREKQIKGDNAKEWVQQLKVISLEKQLNKCNVIIL